MMKACKASEKFFSATVQFEGLTQLEHHDAQKNWIVVAYLFAGLPK